MTDQGDPEPFADLLPPGRAEGRLKFAIEGLQSLQRTGGHVVGEILIRKIDGRLEEGQHADQARPPAGKAFVQGTPHLLQGLGPLLGRLRIDQVGNTFGLGQAQPSVLEGAAGEVSGAGRTATRGLEGRGHPGHHSRPPVQMQFDNVLPGKAAGALEPDNKAFIHPPAVGPVDLPHLHLPDLRGRATGQGLQNPPTVRP